MAAKAEPSSYRFTTIESRFELISYRWFDGSWCPAVRKNDDGTYSIRVLMSRVQRGASTTDKYDDFEISAEGIVTKSPRGYAKEFNKCHVKGLDEAVAQYAKDDPSVPRLSF